IDRGEPVRAFSEKVRMVRCYRLAVNRERKKKVRLEMLRLWIVHSRLSRLKPGESPRHVGRHPLADARGSVLGVNADFGASAPSPSRLSFGVRHPLADARGSVLGVNADFGASAPSPSRLSFGVRHPLANARGSV